jgi:hypothetical protein
VDWPGTKHSGAVQRKPVGDGEIVAEGAAPLVEVGTEQLAVWTQSMAASCEKTPDQPVDMAIGVDVTGRMVGRIAAEKQTRMRGSSKRTGNSNRSTLSSYWPFGILTLTDSF